MADTRSAVLVRPSRARSPASPLNCSAMPGIQPHAGGRDNKGIEGSFNDPLRCSARCLPLTGAGTFRATRSSPADHPLITTVRIPPHSRLRGRPLSTPPPPPTPTDKHRPAPAERAPDNGPVGWRPALGPRRRRPFGGYPPAALRIDGLARPDFGEAVDAEPDDIPVFWACGVTPQAAVTASRPPFALTHAPGRTFLTDARDDRYRVL